MVSYENLNKALVSDEGLRVTFIVIFVALLLTIYELSMFFFVVSPEINTSINYSLENIGNKLRNNNSITKDKLKIEETINLLKIQLAQQNVSTELILFIENILKEKLNDSVSTVNDIKNVILSIFKTANYRENILVQKINNYTKITGILLLLFLIAILYGIKIILNNRGKQIGKCTWVLIAVTIFLIGIFQYVFYMYSKKYKYIGTMGEEELNYYLLNQATVQSKESFNDIQT